MFGAYGFCYCFALTALFCVSFFPRKTSFVCRPCLFWGGFVAISCGQIFDLHVGVAGDGFLP